MAHQTPSIVKTSDVGFLRIDQIIPDLLPISKATFYRCVSEGRYPRPVKLSKNCTAWRKSEINELIEELGGCK